MDIILIFIFGFGKAIGIVALTAAAILFALILIHLIVRAGTSGYFAVKKRYEKEGEL